MVFREKQLQHVSVEVSGGDGVWGRPLSQALSSKYSLRRELGKEARVWRWMG